MSSRTRTLIVMSAAAILLLGFASSALAAPTLRAGVGWNQGHGSYPGLCTGCHSFGVWPAPAINKGAVASHGDRGATCTQCHVVNVPTSALPAPANLLASPVAAGEITLQWSPIAGAVGYRVYRATSAAGTLSLAGSPVSTKFADVGRIAGTRYYYVVKAADGAGLLSVSSARVSALTDASFTVRADQSVTPAVYAGTGWRQLYGSTFHRASTRSSSVAGNKVTVPFRGSAIGWYSTKTPGGGKATVTIDGVSYGTVNLYAAGTTPNTRVFYKSGLSDKAHSLVITVSSAKDARSRGRRVDVDSFGITGIAPGLRAEETKATFAGLWNAVTSASFSGGSARRASDVGASAVYTFKGTGVSLVGTKSPSGGRASVYVDGVFKATVHTWATRAAYGRPLFSARGLAYGTHTVKVVPAGTACLHSTGMAVDADAFSVR